jgi:acyl-CoA reductase-like NAD-dependent aldehyde dehydrogenase
LLRDAGVPDGAFTAKCGPHAESLLRCNPDLVVARAKDQSKSAVAVLEDADLDQTAASLVRGPRSWARSRSLSETLIFVSEAAQAAFIARLRSHANSLKTGNPLDDETEIGQLVSRRHLEQILTCIQEARKSGADLRLGGREIEGYRGRAVALKPTILDNCKIDMRIARQNLFCPVFIVIPFGAEAELESSLRAMGPDLSLGMFGRDSNRIWRIVRNAQASVCTVNDTRKNGSLVRDAWLQNETHKSIVARLTRTRRVLALEV